MLTSLCLWLVRLSGGIPTPDIGPDQPPPGPPK